MVREYLGTGPFAEAFVRQDVEARERQRERQATEQAAHEEDAALVALVEQLAIGTEALVAATLVLSGYHRHHRGEWRRRRVAT